VNSADELRKPTAAHSMERGFFPHAVPEVAVSNT